MNSIENTSSYLCTMKGYLYTDVPYHDWVLVVLRVFVFQFVDRSYHHSIPSLAKDYAATCVIDGFGYRNKRA
jgi:hypothetical protein